MPPFLKRFYLLAAVLILQHFGIGAQTRDSLKILFVGNSLTYVNNLPELVKEIGKWDGVSIDCYSISKPDYSLEDHWNEGTAEEEIINGKYDFVVMQQGPSALPESRLLLLEYAGRFAKTCARSRTSMALYMVWPSKARLFDLDNVIYSYAHVAGKTGALLCPAGQAWKNAWQENPSMALYGPDNFHPGIDGTVLAALTVYGALTGKTDFQFLQSTACSWSNMINEGQFLQLCGAATKALTVKKND
jgi:hypothetical protein